MSAKKLLLIVGAPLLLVVSSASNSNAIPVFARKYKTSCQTCHTVYPRLDPFGVAFRMNGHQWPGTVEDEQEHSKDDAVQLGAEAYKRVFPDAVWPSSLPGLPPLSMLAETGFTYAKSDSGSLGSFDQPTLELQASGTFGENLSFFIAGPIFEDGTISGADLDHFFLELDNLFSGKLPDHALYVRVGKFAPELTTYQSHHDEFTLTPNFFSVFSPVEGAAGEADKRAPEDGITARSSAEPPLATADLAFLEPRVGVQANGLIKSRFRYVVGLHNDGSAENTTGAKNTYARLVYKWGGMAFDGTNAAETDHPYQETSLAAGIFGYRGKVPNDSGQGPDDLTATRVGGELDGTLGSLVLFGGYTHGRNQSVFTTDTHYQDFDMWYVQGEYMVYPWLAGIARYEQGKAEEMDVVRRIVPNITALYRANVAFRVEVPLNPDDLKLDTLLVNLQFAY